MELIVGCDQQMARISKRSTKILTELVIPVIQLIELLAEIKEFKSSPGTNYWCYPEFIPPHSNPII